MAIVPSQLLDPFKVFTYLQSGDTIQPIDRSSRSGQVTDYLHGWGEHESYCRTTPIPLVSRLVRVVYAADTRQSIDYFKMFFKERIAALKEAIESAGTLKDHIYEYLRDVRTGMDCLSRTHYGATTSYSASISTLMGSNDLQWRHAVNEVLAEFDVHIFNKCIDRCIPLALKPFVKEFEMLASIRDGDTLKATGGVPRYAIVPAASGSITGSILGLARTFIYTDTPQTAAAFKSYLAEIFTGFKRVLTALSPAENGFGCRTACRYAWEARESLMTLRVTHVPFSNVKKGGINPSVEENCSPTSQEDIRAFWAFAIDTWDAYFEKELAGVIAVHYDREQDKAAKVEKYIEEFVLVTAAQDKIARADELTEEIQRDFGDLKTKLIDQETVLIAMEMEHLLLSLKKVNHQIVPQSAAIILTYIRGDRPPERPATELMEKVSQLRKEAGDIESLFLVLRINLAGQAFVRGAIKQKINELCIDIQKMDFDKLELVFFLLEMNLGLQAMNGKHAPILPSLIQPGGGQQKVDPQYLNFYSKFDALGERLKYKRAALFLLNACVNRRGNTLLPQIKPEMFPPVQLDSREMELHIQQLNSFMEQIELPENQSAAVSPRYSSQEQKSPAAPFRPSGLRTMSGRAAPETDVPPMPPLPDFHQEDK